MAHHKRKRARIRGAKTRGLSKERMKKIEARGEVHHWFRETPAWHNILYNSRPRRRLNKELSMAVLRGADSEDVAWPLGNRKPHEYYW